MPRINLSGLDDLYSGETNTIGSLLIAIAPSQYNGYPEPTLQKIVHCSRYNLVVLKPYLDEAPVQQLLSTLGHRRVLSQLEALGEYDTSQTGETIATVKPAR